MLNIIILGFREIKDAKSVEWGKICKFEWYNNLSPVGLKKLEKTKR